MTTSVTSEDLAARRMVGCQRSGLPAGAGGPGRQARRARHPLAARHSRPDETVGELVTRGRRLAARVPAWRGRP
jgi:hypothetical protein